jgi:hypothetical protein
LCWFGTFSLGLDFEVDANSGLEFGILIDLGSDFKFEMICRLWSFIWAGFFFFFFAELSFPFLYLKLHW